MANGFSTCFGWNSTNLLIFLECSPGRTEILLEEVKGMDEYLCLTELLDQDLSAYEFFQTLAPMLQDQLRQEDQIRSFAELQARAAEG